MSATPPPGNPLASDVAGALVRELRARLDASGLMHPGAADLRLDLARALYAQQRYSEAIAEGEALSRDPDASATVRVRAMGVLAGALVLGGRPDEARLIAERALAAPESDSETRVLARSALRGLHFFEGRYETAVEDARAVVALARGAGPIARAEASLDMGGMLSHADAFEEAAQWLALDDDAPAHQREEGDELLATMDLAAGRWSAVLDRLKPFDSTSTDADRSEVSVSRRRGLRAIAWLHLDRLEHARRELHVGARVGRAHPTAHAGSALVAEADGDIRGAAALFERLVARANEPGFTPMLRAWGPEVVRVTLLAGDSSTAERATRHLEHAADRTAVRSVHGAAAAARGQIEADPEILGLAVAHFAAGPRAVAHALALEALGAFFGGRPDPGQAIPVLRDAHDRFCALAAERDQRRVARRLGTLGVRTGRAPAASRDRLGWDALTATEATVADLIAEGLSNARIAERLVLSRRTVESHVAHVMAKLDVPSRSGVARAAADRDRAALPSWPVQRGGA